MASPYVASERKTRRGGQGPSALRRPQRPSLRRAFKPVIDDAYEPKERLPNLFPPKSLVERMRAIMPKGVDKRGNLSAFAIDCMKTGVALAEWRIQNREHVREMTQREESFRALILRLLDEAVAAPGSGDKKK